MLLLLQLQEAFEDYPPYDRISNKKIQSSSSAIVLYGGYCIPQLYAFSTVCSFWLVVLFMLLVGSFDPVSSFCAGDQALDKALSNQFEFSDARLGDGKPMRLGGLFLPTSTQKA